jgi:serine/threonine protein kinase
VTEPSDQQGQIVCPSCDSPADPHAVVCVVCGAVLASGIESDQASELLRRLRDALQGRYVLGTAIGLGRAGITIRARRQTGPNRDVAIKVAWDDAVARRDLVREAELSTQLVHPNVLPMTRLDVAPPLVAVEMPLVESGTLGDLIDAGAPVPYQRVVEIVRAIGGALDEAHERGVIHGALRPEKIHLDRDGNTLISGFMLGQFPSGDRDAPLPNSIGSPAYMAFEQRHNLQTIDGRADQFSLSVIAYELLSGRRTWRIPADGVLEIDAIEIMPHRAIAPSVPLSAGAAIKRATWKDPGYRYDSIKGFVGGLTGTALEATPAEHLARVDRDDIKRRSPVWILAPLGVLIFLAAGFRPDLRKTATHWWHVAFTDNGMFVPSGGGEGGYSGPVVDPHSPPTMPSPSGFGSRSDSTPPAPSNARVINDAPAGPAAPFGPDRTFNPYPSSLDPTSPQAGSRRRIGGDPVPDASARTVRTAQGGSAPVPAPTSTRRGESSRTSVGAGLIGASSHDSSSRRSAARGGSPRLAGDTTSATTSPRDTGFLAISVKSGRVASVFVDGLLRGKTPLVWKATAGKHVVSLKGVSKFAPESISVTVTRHDTVRAVFATRVPVPKN